MVFKVERLDAAGPLEDQLKTPDEWRALGKQLNVIAARVVLGTATNDAIGSTKKPMVLLGVKVDQREDESAVEVISSTAPSIPAIPLFAAAQEHIQRMVVL